MKDIDFGKWSDRQLEIGRDAGRRNVSPYLPKIEAEIARRASA